MDWIIENKFDERGAENYIRRVASGSSTQESPEKEKPQPIQFRNEHCASIKHTNGTINFTVLKRYAQLLEEKQLQQELEKRMSEHLVNELGSLLGESADDT